MTLYRYKPQHLVVLVIDQCRLLLARAGKPHTVPQAQNDGHNENDISCNTNPKCLFLLKIGNFRYI